MSSSFSASAVLRSLRRDPPFRRSLFQVRGRLKDAQTLILGIGQIHPVPYGRFERFQARRIGRVQAWIFAACRALRRRGVTVIGQEGFGSLQTAPVTARVQEGLLQTWKKEIGSSEQVPSFIRRTAQRWRKAVRRHDDEDIATQSAALNGLSLAQVFDTDLRVFPLEDPRVHGGIGSRLLQLQRDLEKSETSAAYLRGKAKQGKGLTVDEAQALMQRMMLVREWNALLRHPERDRTIFQSVLRFAETGAVTVFVLGQGHREAQLSLARRHLPKGVAFVWVTPPSLWFWPAVLQAIGWCVLLVACIVGILSFWR